MGLGCSRSIVILDIVLLECDGLGWWKDYSSVLSSVLQYLEQNNKKTSSRYLSTRCNMAANGFCVTILSRSQPTYMIQEE